MNAPAQLRPVSHPQAVKLEALIRTAMAAREAAARGDLFASYAGKSLVLAAHDLFECDGLYAISLDVAHEIGDEIPTLPTLPRVTTPVAKLNRELWPDLDNEGDAVSAHGRSAAPSGLSPCGSQAEPAATIARSR